ncbi:hypothetical protein [Roseibium suaedae]|uniref:DUF2946 domain-containing protein n=1 Tax=Roseibium suaedae TaxID=735517 RepID=A0A1M7NX21_9HYPH|nr:hypothetical protein [Roseibium suaedae]SHN08574.1 hypothetical protein SAMN05444272_4024 [Roseibium suaedae]
MLNRWLHIVFALFLALSAALTGVQSGAMAAMSVQDGSHAVAGQVTEIVICSGEGRRVIRVDESGNELPSPEKHPCCNLTCDNCSLCQTSAGVLPAAPASLPVFVRSSLTPVSLAQSHASARRLARARAPPRTTS